MGRCTANQYTKRRRNQSIRGQLHNASAARSNQDKLQTRLEVERSQFEAAEGGHYVFATGRLPTARQARACVNGPGPSRKSMLRPQQTDRDRLARTKASVCAVTVREGKLMVVPSQKGWWCCWAAAALWEALRGR